MADDSSDSETDSGAGGTDDHTEIDPADRPLSDITGIVFQDDNNNGIQGPGEPGIPGVEVTLTGEDALGNPVNITVETDENVENIFDGLNAGVYQLNEDQPGGYTDGIDRGDPAWTIGDDQFSDIVLNWGESSRDALVSEVFSLHAGTHFGFAAIQHDFAFRQ